MRGKAGAAILAVAIIVAIVGQVWTPRDVTTLDIAHRLAGPGLSHPLGTDQLGRDLVSMLMAGAGPSLATALAGMTIGLIVGVPLGLAAAARPGWAGETITRAGDLLLAFPALIAALLIVAVAGPGTSRAALAIGLFNIPVFLRVTRATGRRVWADDFILAARLAGKSRARISAEHILPNIGRAIIVQAGIQLALGLIAEAGLSYLGLGVQPPAASWGRMLADAQTLVQIAPRLVIAPGLAIVLTALGIVWVADALVERDAP